jgi:reactive chlorine resistance protein C
MHLGTARRRLRRSTLPTGSKLETIGRGILRYGLAGVIATIAAEKFTDYEVQNIRALLENSPLFSWLQRRIGLKRTTRLVGTTELAIAGLLAVPPRRSALSALGSLLALGMFATTLSFIASTPAARTRSTKGVPILSDVGQFLIKDVVLVGVSLLTLGESLRHRALS